MEKKIYQLQIVLKGAKPKIWRRIQVQADTPLGDLHKIIQTVMGWTSSHLHQFIADGRYFEPPMPDHIAMDMPDSIVYSDTRLNDLLKKEKAVMIYEYDFGDGWEHEIRLEKILSFDELPDGSQIPTCIAGAKSCPPEDCGGIWGYRELLQILKKPGSGEYEEMIDWLPEDFDPDWFDADTINKALKMDAFGSPDFWY